MCDRAGRKSRVSCALAAALATLLAIGVPGPIVLQAAEPSEGTAVGSLAVASDPEGASVFVDGQHQGPTPLTVAGLSPGDHRVTLVKPGYLENSRVVNLGAERPSRVQVRLTPDASEVRHSLRQVEAQGSEEKKEGGGSKKWWIIGGVGAVAVGTGVFLATRGESNKAPTAGSITVSPNETGLASATQFSFSSNASDPDNGPSPLTYTWNFGDGSSVSGSSTTHTYTSDGAFNVTVTVSDSKASATTSTTVTVRSLTGTWTGSWGPYNMVFNLTQNGTSVSGSYSDQDGPGSVSSGSVSAPKNVRLTVTQPGYLPFTFIGTADASVSTITGTCNNSSFSIHRQ